MDFFKIVHGFGQKLAMFLSLYYRQNRPGKMCLGIFYKEKKPFHPIKIASWKSGKFGIFPKGLNHGFGQKLAIIQP